MTQTFTHASLFSATPDDLHAFHARLDVLRTLTMPPLILQIIRDDRTSLTEGEIEFRLWFGPIPVRWLARHVPGPIPTSFKDVQMAGPLARWEHEHIFQPAPGGAKLVDRIVLEHKPGPHGWLTRLFFAGLPLRLLFLYRHWRTRRALARQTPADPSPPA